MGKTAVFVITSLQELDANDPGQPSIIALAPTREPACQIASEYQRFKKHMPGVRLGLFFDGTSVDADEANLARGAVHIIVGTPGRLLDLIERRALNLDHIKTFVMDECDKMMMGKSMHVTVEKIFLACPAMKQVLMLSATLSKEILPNCNQLMKNPVVLTVHEERTLEDICLAMITAHNQDIEALCFWEKKVTFANLSDELVAIVFRCLDHEDQQRLMRVCRHWQYVISTHVDHVHLDWPAMFDKIVLGCGVDKRRSLTYHPPTIKIKHDGIAERDSSRIRRLTFFAGLRKDCPAAFGSLFRLVKQCPNLRELTLYKLPLEGLAEVTTH